MNRRGFLGVLGAVLAAPFVPTPAAPPMPWSGIDWATEPDYTAWVRANDVRFTETVARVFNVPAHLLR